MTFKKDISKEEINKLSLKGFEGKIIVIENHEDVLKIIDDLKKHTVLGFDTETRPAFKRGLKNKVALLQLATPDNKVYLFRTIKMGLPEELTQILSNKNIVKTGVAIHDDIIGLQELSDFSPQNFIELQSYVKNFKIERFGLKSLAAIVLNIRISKRQQTSNWENKQLTKAQIKYAATDAWVSYEIYKRLKKSEK